MRRQTYTKWMFALSVFAGCGRESPMVPAAAFVAADALERPAVAPFAGLTPEPSSRPSPVLIVTAAPDGRLPRAITDAGGDLDAMDKQLRRMMRDLEAVSGRSPVDPVAAGLHRHAGRE